MANSRFPDLDLLGRRIVADEFVRQFWLPLDGVVTLWREEPYIHTFANGVRSVVICKHDGLLVEYGCGRDGNSSRRVVLGLDAYATEECLIVEISLHSLLQRLGFVDTTM